MREPIIYSEVEELSTPEYRVVVAASSVDDMPQYCVINRKHRVVEFTHETYAFVKQWLDHFSGSKADAGAFQLPGEFPVGKGN